MSRMNNKSVFAVISHKKNIMSRINYRNKRYKGIRSVMRIEKKTWWTIHSRGTPRFNLTNIFINLLFFSLKIGWLFFYDFKLTICFNMLLVNFIRNFLNKLLVSKGEYVSFN